MPSTKQNQAKEELKKFFIIAALNENCSLTMWSPFIDGIWHELLENRAEYDSFCLKACGKRMLHEERYGYGNIDWINDYHKKFGDLDQTWFMDEHGQLNEQLYSEYKTSKKVNFSWKCGVKTCDTKVAA